MDLVRRELLIPIDGTAEVQANAELEEVENARKQEVRVARDNCLLSENRHAACLNLNATDTDNCTAATHALDLVEECIARESAGAIDENLGIAQNGNRVAETGVRSYSAEMLRERQCTKGDSAHVVDADSTLCAGAAIEHLQVTLKNRLIA